MPYKNEAAANTKKPHAAQAQTSTSQEHVSMTANLNEAARTSLSSFLNERLASNGDIARDVYRALRDEAHLLLEGEAVRDALDADPFELTRMASPDGDGKDLGDGDGSETEMVHDAGELAEKEKNKEMIDRVKGMLRVVSCTRTATLEGYSSIRAVVQLDNDGKMQGINENVRLHFTFLREPQHNIADESDNDDKVFYADADDYYDDEEGSIDKRGETGDASTSKTDSTQDQPAKKRKRMTVDGKDNAEVNGVMDDENDAPNTGERNQNFTPKTIVTYKIEYSVDYGKMEKMLGVDVYALGEHPSPEEAIPLIDDSADAEEENGPENCDVDDGGCCPGIEQSNAEESPVCQKGKTSKSSTSLTSNDGFEEVEMSNGGSSANEENGISDNGDGDRFGVFVDPEAVVGFLDRVNMNLNEQSVFYFLLMFPFYEHEWDIAGFLVSSLYDDDDDDEEDGEMDEENGVGDGCGVGCQGDQPCCLPCE